MSTARTSVDFSVKSVLVAYDFSEGSDKPLDHALAVARHYGAKFHLAHVVSALGFTIAGKQALDMAFDATQQELVQLERQLMDGGRMTGFPHEFILREGNVWEELQNVIRAKQIDVVVVGTHARRGLEKLVLGSVAEQIFRQADCPVLTVGPGSALKSPIEGSSAVRPFVFATDFSPASLNALPYAVSFANHFGAKLTLLHVAPAAPIPEGFHWSTTGDLPDMREHARLASSKQFEDALRGSPPLRVQPEFMVKFGMPANEILHAIRTLQADLVIMSLHRSRHPELTSHLPWTVAYEVVCRAHCSVLTVRS